MDLLILILIIIAVIMAIMIVPLFNKEDYTIQREIIINKPRQEVFDYVKFLKNQDYFSKWVMTDPDEHESKQRKVTVDRDFEIYFLVRWYFCRRVGFASRLFPTLLICAKKFTIEVLPVMVFQSRV